MQLRNKPIKSPCRDICITRDGICIGCYRTLEEMANWRTMSEPEKAEVLEKIKGRRGSQDYYGGPVG